MTRKATIPESEIRRTIRAAKKEGGADARVIVDFARQRLEIVLSPSAGVGDDDEPNPWEVDGAPS